MRQRLFFLSLIIVTLAVAAWRVWQQQNRGPDGLYPTIAEAGKRLDRRVGEPDWLPQHSVLRQVRVATPVVVMKGGGKPKAPANVKLQKEGYGTGMSPRQHPQVKGIIINEVVPGSPADLQGVKAGWRLLAIDGKAVDSPVGRRRLREGQERIMRGDRTARKASLTFAADGERRTVTLVNAAFPLPEPEVLLARFSNPRIVATYAKDGHQYNLFIDERSFREVMPPEQADPVMLGENLGWLSDSGGGRWKLMWCSGDNVYTLDAYQRGITREEVVKIAKSIQESS